MCKWPHWNVTNVITPRPCTSRISCPRTNLSVGCLFTNHSSLLFVAGVRKFPQTKVKVIPVQQWVVRLLGYLCHHTNQGPSLPTHLFPSFSPSFVVIRTRDGIRLEEWCACTCVSVYVCVCERGTVRLCVSRNDKKPITLTVANFVWRSSNRHWCRSLCNKFLVSLGFSSPTRLINSLWEVIDPVETRNRPNQIVPGDYPDMSSPCDYQDFFGENRGNNDPWQKSLRLSFRSSMV